MRELAPGFYWVKGAPWDGPEWEGVEVHADGDVSVLGTEITFVLAEFPRAEFIGPMVPPRAEAQADG